MDPTLANDDTLLLGGIDNKLYALDPATGAENWSFKGGNWFWGSPSLTATRYTPPTSMATYTP